MVSVASGGAAERIAARTFSKVPRAGGGTAARYSSTVLGARRGFVAEPRSRGLVFFTRAMLQELPLQVHVPEDCAAVRCEKTVDGSQKLPHTPPFDRKERVIPPAVAWQLDGRHVCHGPR